LRLTFERAVLFWFPETNPGFPAPYVYATWLATALSFIGLYRLLSTSAPIGWFLLITSVAYSGVYYLVNHDACYRYPILWLTLLCAGHLASEKFHPALAQRYGEALERWRLAPIPRPQTSQRALPSLSANARVGNRVSSPSGFAT
jgi:hypothetical protein